jgi:hypothetical protein
MRSLIAASLLLAISSIALSIFAQTQIYKCADNKVEVAGVIRSIDDKGWFVINEGLHTPINIERVEVIQGHIIIHFPFSASTIHSFIVSPDETFSKEGYIVGAAVTKKAACIAVSRVINGNVVPIDASSIRSQTGNLWIYGLFRVDKQDG